MVDYFNSVKQPYTFHFHINFHIFDYGYIKIQDLLGRRREYLQRYRDQAPAVIL